MTEAGALPLTRPANPVSRYAWAPWTDKKGRLHPLRAIVFVLLLAPAAWLAFRYVGDMLGPRALNALIHGTGYWAAMFLLASLVIRPAKAILAAPSLLVVRRMIGNAALAYASIHLLLYITDQKWQLLHVASEITLRFYLTIGFVTLLGLVTLGATSTDGWVRRLGPAWKRLHRIAYGLAALAVIHYTLQTKADISLPLLTAGIYTWLMLWRAMPAGRDRGPLALLLLAVAASLVTAAAEWLWFRFATHIDPARVLTAELDPSYGLHPAGQILALGLLVVAAAQLRALGQGRAGGQAPFWAVVFGLAAWADEAISYLFGLDWNADATGMDWLLPNLAWTALLALLGLARFKLRDTPSRHGPRDAPSRHAIDVLTAGCLAYKLCLGAGGTPDLAMTIASVLAAVWTVLAWRTWRVSRAAALLLLPLGLRLASGVGLL
ncbi:MAG: hypothetical protein NVSMB18_12200 [Acetobacteraceae bacterium]